MGSHQEKRDESREETCLQVVESFQGNVSRVVLVGEAGIGKTWLARNICERAVQKGSCYLALWLHLNKKWDESSLYHHLAAQLSLYFAYEESEVVGDENKIKKDESGGGDGRKTEKQKEQELKKKEEEELKKKVEELKKKIKEELGKRKNPDKKLDQEEKKSAGEETKPASSAAQKYLLLVLDDEVRQREKTNDQKGSEKIVWRRAEEIVMKDLELEAFLKSCDPYLKILITRREQGDKKDKDKDRGKADEKDKDKDILVREIGPLNEDESRKLLQDLECQTKVDWRASLKFLQDKENDYATFIIKKSKGLPAAIVTLVKALSRRLQRDGSKEAALSEEQKKVFKEFLLSSESSHAAVGAIDPLRYNPVLHLAYELLRCDDMLETATVDCFWHSLDFYEHCGCVYYRDLIANWILEGYFDPVWSVKKAYQDGHSILIELMERGFLKIQEDNVVVPEMAMRNLIDLQYCGFFGKSTLGFARVYGGDKTKGLGKITQLDDMIETVHSKEEKTSTILVSGNRLRRETHGKFFEKPELEGLEVLGLFNPAFESLLPSLSKLKELRVLVLRDFGLLQSIDELTNLQKLHVLEVSGASSLENIGDDFFKTMTQLQSLNLSRLRIKSSPRTISQLSELRCLIMRDCPELEDLPDMQSLTKLEVIDVHGARELKTCFDKVKGKHKNKSKNKNFAHLTKLKHLDLSGSQIDRLPIFWHSNSNLVPRSLTRLLLRDCKRLRRLPILRPLSGLQILDLSGATSVLEIYEVCFEEKEDLRILNLSGTNIRELPDTIAGLSKLSRFLLRDCQMLLALPSIKTLTNLEVLDVSGCTKLEKIEGSFESMSNLCKLDLSGTKFQTLPELPKQSSLCTSKRILLPDSRCFEGDDWSEIEKALKSSGAINQTRQIIGAKLPNLETLK